MSSLPWTALAMGWLAIFLADDPKPAPLFSDLCEHHFPITTSDPRVQKYFDQGLVLCYAFNHPEAIRSFEAALKLEPECAMAHWGIAFAIGPNINAPMMEDAPQKAFDAAQKALKLADRVGEKERALIEALVKRYAADPKAERAPLDLAWAEAMGQAAVKYPDDMDIATIYAESLMDTMPWDYWNKDGTPKLATEKLICTLERVLATMPEHPGANHYYIHAVEASRNPERGLAAAHRLETLAPGAGHLVHMPAHIYLRLGMYREAAECNRDAIEADENYVTACRVQGFYPTMYYSHNVHFLWYALAMRGQSAEAQKAATRTAEIVHDADASKMPQMAWLRSVPIMHHLRFGRWETVLAQPCPKSEGVFERAMWHFSRGIAQARLGNVEETAREAMALETLTKADGFDKLDVKDFPGATLIRLADQFLRAEVEGSVGNADAWIAGLTKAVEMQDALPYMEPPFWYFPVRHYLGAALVESGRWKDAEAVYRADLERVPNNAWSLFGLLETLRHQGRDRDAAEVERRLRAAWEDADITLTSSRF